MSKITPLHAVHECLGASFTDFGGWHMPVRYTSDIAEHYAVRQAAGIFDLCHMGEIEIEGTDAGRALDRALVGNLSAVAVGKAKYSMMCDEAGGILDDLVVYRLADEHFMVVANAANSETVLAEFRSRAHGLDAEIRDARDDWALVAVQGPASVDIISGLTEVHLEDLKYYSIHRGTLAGTAVLLARTGYTGEDGFEVYCRPGNAVNLWEALTDAGEPHGLIPAGLASRDTLRLEAGMPLYGQELSRDRTPFEAGLGRVIAFAKDSDFVGRHALEARRESGVDQQLIGLIADTRRAPRAGYPVRDQGGRVVGDVTSGAPSPTLGHSIALAYISTGYAEPGTSLSIDVRGTAVDAHVVALPFYTRHKN
ncbi:glycine cleavage system aminomethyltransferase GcvT [Nocardioides sp. LMS-CY]|uniref:glycine cleavage system aminomethyltransferase GcvT n=1 Tax=Nocardioides sp. (strain LMS-CY) TaxID=2840457 RepID=UPI001C0071A9|nr:glycine cleavage system aminomethyltransferase GcvT [Nocardioides sp. LMS-CY]QWF22309.1 glycine cleavage system aminomethyltransferase GcvT [Nocardioides sp. LMS-CY]